MAIRRVLNGKGMKRITRMATENSCRNNHYGRRRCCFGPQFNSCVSLPCRYKLEACATMHPWPIKDVASQVCACPAVQVIGSIHQQESLRALRLGERIIKANMDETDNADGYRYERQKETIISESDVFSLNSRIFLFAFRPDQSAFHPRQSVAHKNIVLQIGEWR